MKEARFIPGSRVAGRYRIVSLIGKGGMGEVYRADDLKLGYTVALKFLPRELDNQPKRLDYFLGEVRFARQISHPNVCRVYDVGDVDGQHFLTMEFIDGENLQSLLRRIGPLPSEKGVEIARQLCAGLYAAHSKGILHRDLKPANIMLDARGQIRITDFGLACLISDKNYGESDGTPAYMAPEQLRHGQTSIQSDIFSLGLVLFELFTGRPFRTTKSYHELARQDTEALNLELPKEIEALDPRVASAIGRCLEFSPKNRPASALDIAAELPGQSPLQAVLESGETPSPEMVAAGGDQETFGKRKIVACVLGIALLLFVNLWMSQRAMRSNEIAHPERYLDRARDGGGGGFVPKLLGVTEKPIEVIHGFGNFPTLDDESSVFWYRERFEGEGFANQTYFNNVAGRINFSRARPDFFLPTQDSPTELAVVLSAREKHLLYFRRIPQGGSNEAFDMPSPEKWREWFPQDLIGFDLSEDHEFNSSHRSYRDGEIHQATNGGDTVADISTVPFEKKAKWIPPDPYDVLKFWRVEDEEKNVYRLIAAAWQGQPTYFIKLSEDLFQSKAEMNVEPPNRYAQQFSGWISIVLLFSAVALARRNFHYGRIDRRGGLRLATYVFAVNVVSLICCARHSLNAMNEYYDVMVMGVSQVLYTSLKIWLFYSAIEPSVRRIWPQVLTTSARLFDGRIIDVMVGRDLLIGVMFGAAIQAIWRLNYEVQSNLLGIEPNSGRLNPLTLDGVSELIGSILTAHGVALQFGIDTLLILLLARILLRSRRRAMVGFVVTLGAYMGLAVIGGHPLVSLFFSFLNSCLILILLVRFGVFSVVVGFTVMLLCDSFPITLDSTVWYFSRGALAMAVILATMVLGCYSAIQRPAKVL